ncbi:MAG: anti-sigma factor [Bryobacteraceae bacterium]
MSCREIHALLDAYVDGELDLVTTAQYERHLTECANCRGLYERYTDLHRSVKTQIPYFEAPEGLEDRVRAQLRLDRSGTPTIRLKASFSRWRMWVTAAVVAAVLAVAAMLATLLNRPSTSGLLAQQVVSSHIRSLMANHLSDVVSSDQHTVKPWFSGKLDFSPVVKDLSSDGFPLAGGRLDYLDNRSVAALVYKRRQHTINLFIWPSSESDSNPQKLTIRGYNIVHWTQSHMTYWAISDLNANELSEFVRDEEK